MQEVFEKIIEELEEKRRRYFLTIANTGDEKLDCAYEYVGDALDKAIEIVKQEAEKYDNGWIPCSERLPEDGETYLVTNASSFGQCHTYKGWYDGKHKIWHMEENFERKMNVVAWQPLPQPYQPKGE